ncbi:hypothetical protein ZHAS_00020565 [Anopheles sinensis]|uniref:Uncharacterized protein n=1 Tax=Anopheles sinensis TaxID=74873 RepID=A0A084WQ55_ANOSI|nr:hypothetical protein ZHAS_00020565 [Anopheles sinensis]
MVQANLNRCAVVRALSPPDVATAHGQRISRTDRKGFAWCDNLFDYAQSLAQDSGALDLRSDLSSPGGEVIDRSSYARP